MIIPDVNVLVYSFDEAAAGHERYARWLSTALSGRDPVALVDSVLTGFVRIVTHPRVFASPSTATAALSFVGAIMDAPASVFPPPNRAVWAAFAALAGEDTGIRGNRVPDAYLASVAIANGARLATADRGFARYNGLKWFDPAA